MARRRAGQTRSLRDLVRQLGDRPDMRYGKRRLTAAEAIRRALAEALGPDAASRCRPGPTRGTGATLECRSHATAQRVSLLVPELLQKVRDLTGNDDVQSLRVTVEIDGWQ